MCVAIIGLRFSSFMLVGGRGIGFPSVLRCRRNGAVGFAGSLSSRACLLLFSYLYDWSSIYLSVSDIDFESPFLFFFRRF